MRGLWKFIFTVTIGALWGMFFAQKPGKKLREEFKKSDEPGKLIFRELHSMAKDSGDEMKHFVKNSEELQKVIVTGRDQFDAFVEAAKNLGNDSKEKAQEQLEELAKNAKKAAEDLKNKAHTHATKAKDKLSESMKNMKTGQKAKE